MTIEQLKAQAYDIIRSLDVLQRQLQEVNMQIANAESKKTQQTNE